MERKKELYFDSRDNVSRIHGVQWTPNVDKPICILQIIHGMAEYVERYDSFAQFMADKGILVVGEDHLGHGDSIVKGKPYGYFCEQDAATVVTRDSHRLKKMIQEEYPGVPYIILGHSMGSFILRNYLFRYGTGIQAAIIIGTGTKSGISLMTGKALAAVQKIIFGADYKSKLLNWLSFFGYTKRIKNKCTKMDWLSRDCDVVNGYIEDEKCGFPFTVNGFQTLFKLIAGLNKKKNLQKIPKDLPILFASGTADPVGNYGKGVKKVCHSFLDAGMKNVQMKLYKDSRHEILNETNKSQIYNDIYFWILSVL